MNDEIVTYGYIRRIIPARALRIRYKHNRNFVVSPSPRCIDALRRNGMVYQRFWLNFFLADKTVEEDQA